IRAGSAKRRPSNSLRTRKSRYSVNPAMNRAAVRKAKRRYRQNLGWRNIGRILLCCGGSPLIAASRSGRNPARRDAQVSPCGDTVRYLDFAAPGRRGVDRAVAQLRPAAFVGGEDFVLRLPAVIKTLRIGPVDEGRSWKWNPPKGKSPKYPSRLRCDGCASARRGPQWSQRR